MAAAKKQNLDLEYSIGITPLEAGNQLIPMVVDSAHRFTFPLPSECSSFGISVIPLNSEK